MVDDSADDPVSEDPRCDYCGTAGPMEREHMLPRSKGGGDEPANIAAACHPCNTRKNDRVGRWLPCGRATWQPTDYCLDVSCLKCTPAQMAAEAKRLQLRLSALLARWYTRCRNDTIAEARAMGGSYREIARAAEMSHVGIRSICLTKTTQP